MISKSTWKSRTKLPIDQKCNLNQSLAWCRRWQAWAGRATSSLHAQDCVCLSSTILLREHWPWLTFGPMNIQLSILVRFADGMPPSTSDYVEISKRICQRASERQGDRQRWEDRHRAAADAPTVSPIGASPRRPPFGSRYKRRRRRNLGPTPPARELRNRWTTGQSRKVEEITVFRSKVSC